MEFALHFVIFARDLSIASPTYVFGATSVVSFFFFRLSTHSSRFLPSIAAERVTSVKSTFQWRLNAVPFVPAATYGRATLGANSVVNNLLLAVLYSDPYFGVQFVKDVGLIPTRMVCWSVDPKCPGVSTPNRQPHDRFRWCAYWDIDEHDREVAACEGLPQSLQPDRGITSVN
jgi:hypothetical protein